MGKRRNAKKNSITKVCTITTTNDANVPNDSKPPTISSKRVIEENAPTSAEKLPKIAKTIKTTSDKSAEIFRSVKETCPVVYDSNAFDFDSCNITEVIKFLQNPTESFNGNFTNCNILRYSDGRIYIKLKTLFEMLDLFPMKDFYDIPPDTTRKKGTEYSIPKMKELALLVFDTSLDNT